MIRLLLLLGCLIFTSDLVSQSTIFGPKVGLAAGFQSWRNTRSQPLLSYHADLYIEGADEDAPAVFYGQLGLHSRGSKERVFIPIGTTASQEVKQAIRFNNASLQVGAKKRINSSGKKRPYYSFGLRLEYTVSENFADFEQYAGFLPLNTFVNKWNYGATLSAGYEFPFSEFVGGLVEVSVNPDLSNQYDQQQSFTIISPVNGQNVSLPAQKIRNVTFELTVGFRFLHKVIYIDDY